MAFLTSNKHVLLGLGVDRTSKDKGKILWGRPCSPAAATKVNLVSSTNCSLARRQVNAVELAL